MKEESIDELLKRCKKDLEDITKRAKNAREKEFFKHELEILKKFGVDGIPNSKSMFGIGNTYRLTVELANNTEIIEAKLLLVGEYYDVYYIEKDNRLLRVMKANVVLMELINLSDNEYYELDKISDEKFQSSYENKDDDSYN